MDSSSFQGRLERPLSTRQTVQSLWDLHIQEHCNWERRSDTKSFGMESRALLRHHRNHRHCRLQCQWPLRRQSTDIIGTRRLECNRGKKLRGEWGWLGWVGLVHSESLQTSQRLSSWRSTALGSSVGSNGSWTSSGGCDYVDSTWWRHGSCGWWTISRASGVS